MSFTIALIVLQSATNNFNFTDPVKITSYISLAALALLVACHLTQAGRSVLLGVLFVSFSAIGVGAWLEFTKHVDVCADAPRLSLNEICAEGGECDGQRDFVEIYNSTDKEVDLGCYALLNQKSTRTGERVWANPFLLPSGEKIGSHAVRAWDETEMKLKLRRGDDRIAIARLALEPGKDLRFPLLEERQINNASSYQSRMKNGSRLPDDQWDTLNHDQVKAAGLVGSFGRP